MDDDYDYYYYFMKMRQVTEAYISFSELQLRRGINDVIAHPFSRLLPIAYRFVSAQRFRGDA